MGLSDAALITWERADGWMIHRLSRSGKPVGDAMRVPVDPADDTVSGADPCAHAMAALMEVDWKLLGVRRCWIEVPTDAVIIHALRVPVVLNAQARAVVLRHHLEAALPHSAGSMDWSMVDLGGDSLETTFAVAGVQSNVPGSIRNLRELRVQFFVSPILNLAVERTPEGHEYDSIWDIGPAGLVVLEKLDDGLTLRHYSMDRLGWAMDAGGRMQPGPDSGERLLRIHNRSGSSCKPETGIRLCGPSSYVDSIRNRLGQSAPHDLRMSPSARPDDEPGRGVLKYLEGWMSGSRDGLLGPIQESGGSPYPAAGWMGMSRMSATLAVLMVVAPVGMLWHKMGRLDQVRSEHAELKRELREWTASHPDDDPVDRNQAVELGERIECLASIGEIPNVWVSVFAHLQSALTEVGDVWLDRFQLVLSRDEAFPSVPGFRLRPGSIHLAGCMLVREANLSQAVNRQVVLRAKGRLERVRSALLSDPRIEQMEDFSANFEGLDRGLNVVGFEMVLRLKAVPPSTGEELEW